MRYACVVAGAMVGRPVDGTGKSGRGAREGIWQTVQDACSTSGAGSVASRKSRGRLA